MQRLLLSMAAVCCLVGAATPSKAQIMRRLETVVTADQSYTVFDSLLAECHGNAKKVFNRYNLTFAVLLSTAERYYIQTLDQHPGEQEAVCADMERYMSHLETLQNLVDKTGMGGSWFDKNPMQDHIEKSLLLLRRCAHLQR